MELTFFCVAVLLHFVKHKFIETWIEVQPGMFLKSPRRIRAYTPLHKYKPTDKEKRRKQQREYQRLLKPRNLSKKNEVAKA